MVGYLLKNTASLHGAVSRGVCTVEDGKLVSVQETKNIQLYPDGSLRDLERDRALDPESVVSMNFWGFPAKEGCAPAYLDVLEKGFSEFFENTVKNDPLKAEYLLPIHIGGLLREEKCSVKVLETKDKWFGVTYKEDKDAVVKSFKELIEDGVYAEELYSDL